MSKEKLNMLKYADNDRRLVDLIDAELLARRVGAETTIDFTGVVDVTTGYLQKLLCGVTPQSISGRTIADSPAVEAAISAWAGNGKIRAFNIASDTPTPATDAVDFLSETMETGQRYTPGRLIGRMSTVLRSYIESANPLSDPLLVSSRRLLLDSDSGGHLLGQDPYVETTPRYEMSGRGYEEIGLPASVGALFARLSRQQSSSCLRGEERTILFPAIYRHQEEAFRRFINEGRDIVVATGTGSGKTECFLLPILASLYREATERPESFCKPGVRALIIYPMNALVNDQLARLRLLFGDPVLSNEFSRFGMGRFPRFGMYTGRTPYPGPRSSSKDADRVAPLLSYYLGLNSQLQAKLKSLGRYPAKDLDAFDNSAAAEMNTYQSGERMGETYIKHNWGKRLQTSAIDRELLTRHEMVNGTGSTPGHSPDILVTNYSMLEYMLMRPFERPVFREMRDWLELEGNQLILVLDEAHMYRGAAGAEVAFLIRRLQARLGIQGRPEKLRIIATSASLGSGEDVQGAVVRFAADLTGKASENFALITGQRDLPKPAAPATTGECRMLAGLDIRAVNEALTGEALAAALAPIFNFYGEECRETTEPEVLASLYRLLKNRPCVNQLIGEAAGKARSLVALATAVFGEDEQAVAALEALLTIGTLARPAIGEPGLIPSRIHAIFRGLHGLYACINSVCSGRQSGPSEPATLGKLFTTHRIRCDACGSRVFEIASCRSCGTVYLQAYIRSAPDSKIHFLWGETEGDLEPIQLLPVQPRYTERTERIDVHLRTGFVDLLELPDPDGFREMYYWTNDGGSREMRFGRCAMCQPPSSARARITDFRSRGEGPFTTLVETQFAEQPPQKNDPELPNRGRKVLVFSDGRQRAARLAPAIEYTHTRDLFRQVIAIAAIELRRVDRSAMLFLYPAVVWLCANRGYNLFPDSEDSRFPNDLRLAKGKSLDEVLQLANYGAIRPIGDFGRALYAELTDRYYSIPALALGTIEIDPIYSSIHNRFPEVGLSLDGQRILFNSWLRLQLERRRFSSIGADISKLGDDWERPEGINPSNLKHLLPASLKEYLDRLLDGDQESVESVIEWFRYVVCDSGILDYIDDRYYLTARNLTLNINAERKWLRCCSCARIHPDSIDSLCPGCLGKMVDAERSYLVARTGHYQDQVRRALDKVSLEPFGLIAREHSAQLNGDPEDTAFNKLEEYELRFQDIDPGSRPGSKAPIDILSCTTTMEVGIDIGTLSAVALRNVPPQVSNYQQRAGRAGRRGRSIASVVTYANGTSHDSHFFANPESIISGPIRVPIINIENQQILDRHISAWLVQRFFHDVVPGDVKSNIYMLFESLGTVRDFMRGDELCSLWEFERWLDQNEASLRAELYEWVPSYSYSSGKSIPATRLTIDRATTRIKVLLNSVLPVGPYSGASDLTPLEKEMLEIRLDQRLLEILIEQAVLPRYAFPTDTVKLWVIDQRSRKGEKRRFTYQPQRDLGIALSEYAPTRTLTIDSHRYESVAIFSPTELVPTGTLERCQEYYDCGECTYVSISGTGGEIPNCPCCGSESIKRSSFIRPTGFATDINVRPEIDRGQAITYAGQVERARLELQDPPDHWHLEHSLRRIRTWAGSSRLAVVNKGKYESGFMVCPTCGRSEPGPAAKPARPKLMKGDKPVNHDHPLESGVVCSGSAVGPFYLGYQFPTDVMLMRLKVEEPMRLGTAYNPRLLSQAARVALGSLIESISLAATRELQIDDGELSGWWTPIKGAPLNEAQLYLYDNLAGGAGFARAVQSSFDAIIEATDRLLRNCECAQSCYNCIRHYGNNLIHPQLDRRLALDLLRHLAYDEIPVVNATQKQAALGGLTSYLELMQIQSESSRQVDGQTIPLIIERDGREVWIDLHHPLVDPLANPSPISRLGRAVGCEVELIDAYTLLHNLPAVVGQLRVLDGARPTFRK